MCGECVSGAGTGRGTGGHSLCHQEDQDTATHRHQLSRE